MKKKVIIYYNKIRQQLWFRPLLFCLFSVFGALLAHQIDGFGISKHVPSIDTDSIKGLLDTISSSMLVISIFAVTSMLSAFSSASSTATPRSFKIVVTDDVSQNALSVFIGAFIFSIVATIALDNGYYQKAGRFLLFLLTLILFTVVILTFLRWVDKISRLGRLEHTIQQIETVASKALATYIKYPNLKANPIKKKFNKANAICGNTIGYIQHINIEVLHELAEEKKIKIQLNCLPGKFINKNFVVAYVSETDIEIKEIQQSINSAIHVGHNRLYEDDPRLGFTSLTEIASRALSPGINDPGTAIQIIGCHERLFFLWQQKAQEEEQEHEITYNRVEVPQIAIADFFDDAFRPIARDGANNIEVMLRLQKTFKSIATIDNDKFKKNALKNSEDAYNRAEKAIEFNNDLILLRKKCLF